MVFHITQWHVVFSAKKPQYKTPRKFYLLEKRKQKKWVIGKPVRHVLFIVLCECLYTFISCIITKTYATAWSNGLQIEDIKLKLLTDIYKLAGHPSEPDKKDRIMIEIGSSEDEDESSDDEPCASGQNVAG